MGTATYSQPRAFKLIIPQKGIDFEILGHNLNGIVRLQPGILKHFDRETKFIITVLGLEGKIVDITIDPQEAGAIITPTMLHFVRENFRKSNYDGGIMYQDPYSRN